MGASVLGWGQSCWARLSSTTTTTIRVARGGEEAHKIVKTRDFSSVATTTVTIPQTIMAPLQTTTIHLITMAPPRTHTSLQIIMALPRTHTTPLTIMEAP